MRNLVQVSCKVSKVNTVPYIRKLQVHSDPSEREMVAGRAVLGHNATDVAALGGVGYRVTLLEFPSVFSRDGTGQVNNPNHLVCLSAFRAFI